MQEVFEKIIAEFDKRINTQLKIMAGLGDETYRYGFGKSLEAYQQGKGIVEQAAAEYTNGWIPVESGILPKQNEDILATVIFNGEIIIATITYFPDWLKGEQRMIAWQPLPEAYQPKGE